MDEDDFKITVCQGPPYCEHTTDQDNSVMDNCKLCKRIYIAPNGDETIIEPSFN